MSKETKTAQGIRIEQAITIDRPAEELFRYWRDLENLPGIMDHLETVEEKDERLSHWVARGPGRTKLEWDAEIINEEEGRVITWRSLEGADLGSAGAVRFNDAPGGRGTEVRLVMQYDPIGGAVGAKIVKLFDKEPAQEIRTSLRKFKALMEAGEVPTTGGQPSGTKESVKSEE